MGMSNLPSGWHASPASPPLERFRVDAWNAGDGALFVSLRPARVDVWSEQVGPEVETYLLRAPDFDAVPVARALAYGAVRRGGQEGFSLDGDQEVAFDTLAQVRELARRAYIASAIGDGGPEGDAPPQEGPPPPDSGPSLPRADIWIDGGNWWSEDLARAVDQLSLETSGQERREHPARLAGCLTRRDPNDRNHERRCQRDLLESRRPMDRVHQPHTPRALRGRG